VKPTIDLENAKVFFGSCLDVLPTFADNSVDAIVTDPPYELGFMGKSWDNSGIAYNVDVWRECLRVLKPGGHILAFGGSRTWHRLAVAIEDSGFEMRDSIAWLYGSGFPKSHNISKAIDKLHGAEREVIGRNPNSRENATKDNTLYESGTVGKTDFITEANTDDAKQWDGWGTALKPAFEPIVVGRKPLVGTIAQNVLEWGVGGINIDATRIGTETVTINTFDNGAKPFGDAIGEPFTSRESVGRWPANIILDEYTAELLDEQSDASRFFYVAKASKKDRNEGLEELPEVRHADRNLTDGVGGDNPRNRTNQAKQNFHPTVKPTALMQYLVRLVTPPNGTVLDPFTGSGSTGKAAILEGFSFIGVELTEEYLPIIAGRLEHAINTSKEKEDDLFASL
jgi:site-specific DNA-methyltransferase (adenine-specific)